ncbi:MAG: phosphatidylglycerol lysyltransferase domain-containing protein [Clostridia bacterium]
MLEFNEITFNLKEEINRRLSISNFMGCQFSFTCQYIYRIYYRTKVAFIDDFVIFRNESNGKYFYLYPAGSGDIEKAIKEIINDATSSETPFAIAGIDTPSKEILEKFFSDVFEIKYDRDNCDYIYNADDLINLSGKKYHSKRNHLKQFEKAENGCSFEPITKDNISLCKEVFHRWLEEKEGDFAMETSVIDECIENFTELGLVGGLLRGNCGICAFTLGNRLNSNTFVTHIEKSLSDCKGSSAAINNKFAKYACKDYKYINREEDMGIEGLRKAKLSYKPAILLDDYTAFYKG